MTRITAKPGTAEHDQQFEQQEREALDNATKLVVTRVASGIFAMVIAAMMIVWICEPALQGKWWGFAYELAFVLVCGIPFVLTLLCVAIFGKTPKSLKWRGRRADSAKADGHAQR